MTGGCNCPISGIRLEPTVQFQPYIIARIKFEQIVMVMIIAIKIIFMIEVALTYLQNSRNIATGECRSMF